MCAFFWTPQPILAIQDSEGQSLGNQGGLQSQLLRLWWRGRLEMALEKWKQVLRKSVVFRGINTPLSECFPLFIWHTLTQFLTTCSRFFEPIVCQALF